MSTEAASRQLLAGIQASSTWEGHRAIGLKTQRRLVSRLSVFARSGGYRGGAFTQQSDKAVSVGARARTKPTAK